MFKYFSFRSPFIALAVLMLVSASAQAQLTFTNSFNSDWAGFTAGTTAVNNAETILSSLFTNKVNVTIQFSYNSSAGGGAYADFNTNDFPPPFGGNAGLTYGQVKTDLANAAAANPQNTVLNSVVSHLPSSVSSTKPFFLPEANALALGAPTSQYPANTNQGFITVGTGSLWDPTQSDGISFNMGDLTGVLLHEITHVMGRVDYSFVQGYSPVAPVLTPFDLSRYTLGGGLNFTSNNAVFSIDGGATALNSFSTTSDTGDWGNLIANDANNAFFHYGQTLIFSSVDIKAMQAIGWEAAVPVPEPDTYAMLLAGLGLLGFVARRRKQPAA